MKSIFQFIAVAFFALSTGITTVQAQQAVEEQATDADIIFRTGSNAQNVYHVLYTELRQVCKRPSTTAEFSSGSIASLDALINNQANLAFVQSDVLYGRKTIENDVEVDTVRTFMPLYYSELHMLASRNNTRLNTFSDLDSKKIGAYGGAYITARILLGHANIKPFSVQQYSSEDEGLKALQAGQIDAFFLVTGQPAKSIQALNGNAVKLLAFDRMDALSKINFYNVVNLRYQNLSATTVKSIGVQIDLVTRDYKDKKVRADLSELKNCMITNIDTLRDKARNHPKWREIKPMATVDWPPMFQTTTTQQKGRK